MTDAGDLENLTALPVKRFRSSKADMEVFRWNLYRIVEEMRPMTVRQVFYQAVVRGYVEKLESEVDRVGANLVMMRKASYDDKVAKKIGDAPAMPLDWIQSASPPLSIISATSIRAALVPAKTSEKCCGRCCSPPMAHSIRSPKT